MNKDELLRNLEKNMTDAQKELLNMQSTNPLEEFSTTQLKKELRRRKKNRYRGK